MRILEAHGEWLVDVLQGFSLLIFGFGFGVYTFGTQLAARVDCAMISGAAIGPVCGLMQTYHSLIPAYFAASGACLVFAMAVRGYLSSSGIFSTPDVATCNNNME